MLARMVRSALQAVEVEATRACSAQELVSDLLGSKAMGRRVLAEQRVDRADDGRALVGASRVMAGERVVLRLAVPEQAASARHPHPCADKPNGSHAPARILWHDRFALAANKPTGLLVHGDGTGAATLADRVRDALRREAQEQGWPFFPEPQAVNRLDVDTSGIVLFSLAKEFQPAFDALVASHDGTLRKCYLAIVEGAFPQGPLTLDAPLARDRHRADRMRVGRLGKPSQTRVACVDRRAGFSLVACRLLTGRRHQIRVHLAHAGHPLAGDALYGHAGGSLMLHAYALDFVHPVTGERHVLCTEWPGRFAKLFLPRDVDWSILN